MSRVIYVLMLYHSMLVAAAQDNSQEKLGLTPSLETLLVGVIPLRSCQGLHRNHARVTCMLIPEQPSIKLGCSLSRRRKA